MKRLLVVAVMVVACGDRQPQPSKFGDSAPFGSNDDRCASAALLNELEDEFLLIEAMDCFFAEVEAGRPVTVDIDVPTVEGDSIYNRYRFDGTSVLIVQDSRADSYGNGVLRARECAAVYRTASGLPEGTDCRAVTHPGFPEAG